MILFHSLDMPAEKTAALTLIAPTSVSLAYRAPIMEPIEVPPIISIGIPGESRAVNKQPLLSIYWVSQTVR